MVIFIGEITGNEISGLKDVLEDSLRICPSPLLTFNITSLSDFCPKSNLLKNVYISLVIRRLTISSHIYQLFVFLL